MYIYEYHTSVMQVIQCHCQERIILTRAPCEKQFVGNNVLIVQGF